MTTANGYLAKTASICGTSYNGAVSFSISRTGTPLDLRSDGEIYQRKSALVNIVESLTIELRDYAQAPSVGNSGATVLTAAIHTGGTTLAGTRTCTAAASTVEQVEHATDINGAAVLRVTLSVQSADGLASGIAWTSA